MSVSDLWRIENTAELLQQIAAYVWVTKGDEHKSLYEKLTGARIAVELYERLSSNSLIDAYKAQCIGNIAEFIKANPRASEAELMSVVEKHVKLFKEQVDSV